MLLKETEWVQAWIQEAELNSYRRSLRLVLESQFGELADKALVCIEEGEAEWCLEALRRNVKAESLAELGLK